MLDSVQLRKARPADWPAISALLQDSGLPLDGAHDHLADFVVATQHDSLIGCAGLERHGLTGLLRSVAVKESVRGGGLGKALTQRVLANAREGGLRQVVLLTETAANYFPLFGFKPIPRAAAPVEAQQSVEFRMACAETAIVMLLDL